MSANKAYWTQAERGQASTIIGSKKGHTHLYGQLYRGAATMCVGVCWEEGFDSYQLSVDMHSLLKYNAESTLALCEIVTLLDGGLYNVSMTIYDLQGKVT